MNIRLNLFSGRVSDVVPFELEMLKIGLVGVDLADSIEYLKWLNEMSTLKSIRGFNPDILVDQQNSLILRQAQKNGQWDVVQASLEQSIQSLIAAGVDFVIISNAGVERIVNLLRGTSKVPIMTSADVMPQACKEQGYTKVGILGHESVVNHPAYAAAFKKAGIEAFVPYTRSQPMIEKAIEEMRTKKRLSEESQENLLLVAKQFKDRGCNGIVLASSELNVHMLNLSNCGLHTMSAISVLVEKSIDKAMLLSQKNEFSPRQRAAL